MRPDREDELPAATYDGTQIEELKHELDLYGFVVVEDLISATEAGHLAERLKTLIGDHVSDDGPDLALRGVFNLMDPPDYDLFHSLFTHPLCLELARHALGESIQMVEVTALLREWGAPAHSLHCTAPAAWFADHGFPMPRYRIVLPFSWILTDLSHESGSRLFMPFSQLSGRLPVPDHPYKHVTRIEARAGSLIMFNGATWHGQAANDSPTHQRIELASGYMPGWYDLRAVNYRLMKPGVWKQLPPEMQALNPHLAEE